MNIIESMKLVALLLLAAALPLSACTSAAGVRAPAATSATTTTVSASTSGHRVYVVGGRVKGLEGIGLALGNSRGQEIQVEDDGRFVFRRTLEDGADFTVTIERQPISPAQSCVIEHAEGKIAGKNAMETTVVCTTLTFDSAPAWESFASR